MQARGGAHIAKNDRPCFKNGVHNMGFRRTLQGISKIEANTQRVSMQFRRHVFVHSAGFGSVSLTCQVALYTVDAAVPLWTDGRLNFTKFESLSQSHSKSETWAGNEQAHLSRRREDSAMVARSYM
eukprot:2507732-Amphidinium_carterae.1